METTNSQFGSDTGVAVEGIVWRPEDTTPPRPDWPDARGIHQPEILDIIEKRIKELDAELRELSVSIHDHPELGFQEHHAHDVLTNFMLKQGFNVTKHFHLDTAWLAAYSHGKGGRTIGINSEMDALKGVGHGCGHNLIAIAGVAVACAIKAVLEKFNISGKIELLGTPAEEGGCGKVILLEKGAYKQMDICLMCHPAPGPKGSVSLSSCLALQRIEVEYFGHTAHAALSPWEGQNALDAAVLAYNNISVLRQQMKPTHRVHGIFENNTNWAVNIIPDYAKMSWYVRAPTLAELESAVKRVTPCFEAAALATGCSTDIKLLGSAMYDLRQNKVLGDEVASISKSRYGSADYEWGIKSGSTDFGNVTYALPSLHPAFAIPTVINGGNHTVAFTEAALSLPAHNACLDVSKALAATAVRVLTDDVFFMKVQNTFEEDKYARDIIV